ncbi:ribosomal small subunit pseudouridine synthase A [Crenobacter luteus]|uniref:pseudouridine synthase n=1 Tax=Crenobacter luteus TaxID=1452487 RepID=UPI0010F089CE|nr:RNA pseudouridine synthase [Crenobacter luteus]TCP09122.1 ribosomal small subunit pseudouridine synthase A [Crenobacter luteus]
MELYRLLHEQGFGGRKACKELVEAGLVEVDGEVVDNARARVDPDTLETLLVDGEPWPLVRGHLYLMLNKPGGYETSHKPTYYPSVFSLLPWQYGNLDVNAVGRLDADTTGLLLLTTDGQFVHALTSPKKQVGKVYRVTIKHPIGQELVDQLLAGVLLKDDDVVVAADAVDVLDPHTLDMTLFQGKYHQVKRMVAAAGNRVEALHRIRIGELALGELAPGQWRHLSAAELASFGF